MESKVICRNSVKLTEVRHNRLRDTISKEYNCDWSLISSKRRFTDLVEARRCYYSILRNIFF